MIHNHAGAWHRSSVSSKVVDLVVALLFLLPESEVLLEELDDALGVTEVVLLELVDLVESVLEGLVGELASLFVVLENFVMEDGEVEGKSELDGVAGRESDLVGLGVSLESLLLDLLEEGVLGVLGDVAVVVTDHLDEESLGLTVGGLDEDLLFDHVDDALAVGSELRLDLGFVVGEGIGELGVLGVLLDGGNGAASSSLGGDQVLEGDGEEVSLIGGDIGSLGVEDEGEEVDHVFKALSLLGDAGQKDIFFDGHFVG